MVAGGSVLGAVLVSLVLVVAVTWSAAPAAEKPPVTAPAEAKPETVAETKTEAAADTNKSSLDPTALLQAYEKTLVPYRRFKMTWTQRFAMTKGDEKPKWQDRVQETTLLFDQDRARSISKANDEEADPLFPAQECAMEKGKIGVRISSGSHARRVGNSRVPAVEGLPDVSEKDLILLTTPGDIASRGWIHFQPIPAFLREAKLSAERGEVEGHAVHILRGTSGDTDIILWLDPCPRVSAPQGHL